MLNLVLHSVNHVWACLVSQMIASKYLNDEGEAESVLNSEWAKIGKLLLALQIFN